MQSNYHNLPVINGTAQAYGQAYKATEVSFTPKRMSFSVNIASAYPTEASVEKWIRSCTLAKASVKVEDSFTLTRSSTPNQINFLTWGNVDITRTGEITIEINNEKVRLAYDKNVFAPAHEIIPLDDTRLSNVWGKEVYRVSLNAVQIQTSGTYSYTITKIK
jgi:hypothetical protein